MKQTIKETADVISSDPHFTEFHTRFTAVLFQPLYKLQIEKQGYLHRFFSDEGLNDIAVNRERSYLFGGMFEITLTVPSIFKFGLSVCLFVCLYPINVKTAEPIGPKFDMGHHVTTGKVYE